MRKMKFSLKRKTVGFAVCISFVIAIMAIVIFYKGIQDVIQSQYKSRSLDIANLVASEISSERLLHVQEAVSDIYYKTENKVMSDQWGTPEFEEYSRRFSPVAEMDDYQTLLSDLRRMQNALDVNCLYIIWVDPVNSCCLYLIDADYEEPCPIGCIDPLYEENKVLLTNPEIGFQPNITNTDEYGWLITTGMPVFGNQGKVIAYAAVDISMNTVMGQTFRSMGYAALAFLAVTVIVCILIIVFFNRSVIRPIKTLTQAAENYTNDRKTFSKLNICREDEIGVLADSMVHMEAEINSYIDNLEQTTNALRSAREHAEYLERIANVDPMTKVFNKRAFIVETKRLDESKKPYAIVMVDMNNLKTINDTYGHEKGDISISTLSQTICWTFRHSSVYRVGGDEFIVILEGDDYEVREELIQSLRHTFQKNQRNSILPPWKRVTAAVGSADFDPNSDESADTLLTCADQAMYREKKAMKAAALQQTS